MWAICKQDLPSSGGGCSQCHRHAALCVHFGDAFWRRPGDKEQQTAEEKKKEEGGHYKNDRIGINASSQTDQNVYIFN